ncbi:MAG: sigma-70 family RNA polymerase sigma factor [Polyangia bacterium]|jgi:RNA polymerase sigma-70 factor (ECF subfamily)
MSPPRQVGEAGLAEAVSHYGFPQVYRDYAGRVARWAGRLGGAGCDVEDVVQEVFLVVSRKLASFRREGNLTSWLFQITRKIVANQRRRMRWRRLWTGDEDMVATGLDPDAELDRGRTIALFHRALDRLPEKQRTVLVLYELEGLSTAAIAELAERPISTVKVQLARARQGFVVAYRRLLRKECGSDAVALAQLAQRVVVAAPPLPRLGRKTS